MSRKFWLKSIRLHKSPGFEAGTFPPVQDLGEHLNIIWGPNGVGKSTLTRAMRSLIWKGKTGKDVEASGVLLESGASSWDLSLSNGKLRQTRLSDDQEIMLPGRNDELSESYWFTLHELLQEDAGHAKTFLHEVRTRMQGGVDLDAALESAGGIPVFSRATAAQAKSARDAIDSLRQVIRDQQEHQHIQDDIEQLQRETNEGSALAEKKATRESAQFLLETKEAVDALEQRLASYDPAIGSIKAESPQRLEELTDSLQKARIELEKHKRLEDELAQEFKDCSVKEHHLQDLEKPLRLKHRFEAYEKATTSLKASADLYAQAEETLREWEAEHSWLMSDPPEDATLQAYVEKMKSLASECEPLRCSLDANKKLAEELGEYEQISQSSKDLSLLQLRLSDWVSLSWKLLGTQESKPLKKGTKKRLLLFVSLAGILGAVAGIVVHPTLFIGALLLMLAIVALLVPSSGKSPLYKQREGELEEKRGDLEQLFAKLGMEGPTLWSAESCQALSGLLGEEIAAIQQSELLNNRRKRAEEQLEGSLEKVRLWNREWKDAALDLGLKDDEARLEGAQFFHFAQRLGTWSEHRIAFWKASRARLVAQEESEKALSALQGELDTTEDDFASLKAMSEGFAKRLERAASLRVALTSSAKEIASAQEELEASSVALQQFWKMSTLESGSDETLKSLASQVEQWNDLKRTLRHKQGLFDERSKETPEALVLTLTYSADDLNEQIEQIERQQDVLKTKFQSLGGLLKTYEDLKFGSALSTAQLEETKTQEMLEAFREEQVQGRMISLLASELKEESEKRFQPQVLEHASQWLTSITNNRYTLSASDEGFFATDTIMAKNYKVEELSSGTRIQLLFSIRMAFITMQEKTSEVLLPIFLDEVLANSDDYRASAIVQAIGKIAQERQVFYVTAQSDEVERLSTIESPLVTVIPLEDLTREYKVAKTPLKPYVHEKREIPAPLEDYQQYAQALSVSGPSLWEPVEGLHSWHLYTDSQQLYGYLKKGLTHCGQLLQALGSEHPLNFRLKLLEAAQKLAQEGRCKILDVSALEGSAMDLNRNANYWSQILEKVGEEPLTGNDLLNLVADKEIKNFSAAKQEILNDWLLEHDFASEKDPKGTEDILKTLFVMFEAFVADSEDEEVVCRWLEGAIGEDSKYVSLEN